MIKHFSKHSAELDVHPADDRHVGKMVNKWRHCYVDGLWEIGFSNFNGDMSMPSLVGYRGLLVITSGSGELHEGGNVARFETGDVLVYEPPVGDSRLVSAGCTYVYMTLWDTEQDRARIAEPPD